MLAIPLYRAKKIDSDEYVEGDLHIHRINQVVCKSYINETSYYILTHRKINPSCNSFDGMYWTDTLISTKIDPKTLAIHFPDMRDSKRNKIFASLAEDGKGGDYTNCEELPVIFCWDSLNACVCLKGKYEYTALFKDGSTNSKNTTFNEYTIIGIQE